MAVRAIVLRNDDAFPSGNEAEFILQVGVIYFDSTKLDQIRDTRSISIPINWTDSLATMRTKVSAAVVSAGLDAYPTLVGSDVIIPSYQKGL